MKFISCDAKGAKAKLSALFKRTLCPAEIENAVAEIVAAVRKDGDKAVCAFLAKFDKVPLKPARLRARDEEFEEAARSLDAASRKAIKEAFKNITAFAKRSKPEDWSFSPRKGVALGERFTPLKRVGCYVPGGTAPLVSTVIHTAGIAKAAGVEEIVCATPPRRDGSVHAATLYAMGLCGAREVYKMGGAYAVAALAFGTKSVPQVEKIVGPGNAYVTAAKRLCYGGVAIDMVAGPSEIMVVADETANPAHIAADLLSQAEHGSGLERAVVVSPSKKILEAAAASMREQAKRLSRLGPVEKVMKDGVCFIECRNLDEAASIAGDFAPEHLEILCANPRKVAAKVSAAGAIFLGHWTPEPVGDFTAGPSHVLPTAGSAKFFHGLSTMDFMRRSSLVEYSRDALLKELPSIAKFAEMEGLDAHGRSASIRKDLK
jgi:histidinol dehydrogenase